MNCGRTHLLEAAVAGETPRALELELRAHANTCARCRHELNWLDTEQKLFRERAGRDEVAELWKGVATRSGLERPRKWSRVFVALAASVLAVLGASRLAMHPVSSSGADASVAVEQELSESELMSVISLASEDMCSRLPDGMGFHCGPAVPASFVASR